MYYSEIDHPYVGRIVKADWMPVAEFAVGVIETALMGEDGVTKFVFRKPGSPECRYIKQDDIFALRIKAENVKVWPWERTNTHVDTEFFRGVK